MAEIMEPQFRGSQSEDESIYSDRSLAFENIVFVPRSELILKDTYRTSSRASVTSSIFDYEKEHGRTYHAYHAGKYPAPNDKPEQERMDLHYHAMRLSIGDKLFHAPIENPKAILDVGTGTGLWAMDTADKYPEAKVTGWDLSPIQPGHVPPNLQFEIFDAEESWDIPDGFDFVHTRFMHFALKSKWAEFYKNAFESLKPGGWVENQEFTLNLSSDDNSIPNDSKMKEWVELQYKGASKGGFPLRTDPDVMAQAMREAGFTNVEVKPFKMPIGPWPKDPALRDAGLYNLVAYLEGIYGLSVRIFTRFLGWDEKDLQEYLVEVKTDLRKKSMHSYYPVWVVYGQKPV